VKEIQFGLATLAAKFILTYKSSGLDYTLNKNIKMALGHGSKRLVNHWTDRQSGRQTGIQTCKQVDICRQVDNCGE